MTMRLQAERHEYPDQDALLEDYFVRDWTDGLPVVPPTPEKVERFLAYAGLPPDEILGSVPTRDVVVTAEHAAINAVMAGCKPEYFPVVVAAVRAHLNEMGNCHSTTATLAGAAQVIIVNGPIRREIGIACEQACLGPGFRANATIGRALRLLIRNVCRAVPGFLDRASFSWPLRYSFCFGENEEASDWVPLHVQRGFDAGQSTATVHSLWRYFPAPDETSTTPEGILDSQCAALRHYGLRGDDWLGDGLSVVIVVGPMHQRYFMGAGWSKARMQEYLWPRITRPSTGPGDQFVNIGKPEGLLFVAAGAVGSRESWILLPHLAWAVTKEITPTSAAGIKERI
jgi:hypothetical protein